MLPEAVILAVLILITLIYAAFDTFNKRNIPNWFAYASLVISFLVTLTYQTSTITYSIIVAAIVGIVFYVLYRAGQVGAGDGFELVSISLLVPIQPASILGTLGALVPFQSPFILSVFVATGVITLVCVPIYYLLLNRSKGYNPKGNNPTRSDLAKATVILIAYLFLYLLLIKLFGSNLYGTILILIVGVSSAAILMYGKKITSRMVSLKGGKDLEDGDIIAINLINKKTASKLSSKYKGFGRLVDAKLLKKLERSSVRLPVYDNSVPLSLAIFFAVIASLLLGNLLFFLL